MSSAEKLAILRIELAEIEPLIWRRVAVRSSTNLETLHKIIQTAMGWLDYHLWEFTVDDVIYGVPDPDDASWGHKVQRASTTKLAKALDSGVNALSTSMTWATTGSIGSSSSALSPPNRTGSIPSSWAVSGAVHLRIAAARQATMTFWTP